jgi:Zn-dependent protease/CBS domain-containing protein
MKWSFKIATISGIGIYVHATFVLILIWVGFGSLSRGGDTADAIADIVFILALFGCVVLHELGHALTAKRFGIKTRDITLLPIGGLARLEKMPDKPMEELAVALAGPAVNVVIAAVIYVGLGAAGLWAPMTAETMIDGPFLQRLFVVNIFLVLFNMLPAFPMDGGRALRAILASRMGQLRATRIAASVGQGMALLFGFVGLFSNPFLVFIALFVWMGATAEYGLAQTEAFLADVPVRQAMVTGFHALSPKQSLGEAVQMTLAGPQTDFPVLEEGEVIGILTQGELLKGLSEQGPDSLISHAMHSEFETATPEENLEAAFRRLQLCQCRTLPVLDRGELVGLLTRDNVMAYLNIQSVMAAQHHGPGRGPQLVKPLF